VAEGVSNVGTRPPPVRLGMGTEGQDIRAEAPVGKDSRNLDGEKAKRTHRQLLDWYYEELERQSVNRFQMALDCDFYDGDQWDANDAAEVLDRGQAPLVYNEIAPMVDWLIGTERRARVDWSVLPRTEDDVHMADVKKKVLKYVSDVNHVPYARSKAFAEAMKAGLSWIEDGARNDPTAEILYSRQETWRNVIWDSTSRENDLSDCRYQFRWKWVDLDIAIAMAPHRREQLEAQAWRAGRMNDEDEEIWYMNQRLSDEVRLGNNLGRFQHSGTDVSRSRRARVKLIEGWYRIPQPVKMLYGDPSMQGAEFNPDDERQKSMLDQGLIGVTDMVALRMQCALFTERDMIKWQPSPYRHQRFPLTPLWAYRRNRDGMPYAPGRRVRDVQEDMNKRASKSLFLLSTNQIIADEGAVEDWDEAREQVDRPDGVVIKKQGKAFEVRRDSEMVRGQMEFIAIDAARIRESVGINSENLGRQSNANSGIAIQARQMEGAVSTTELFDNLRFAIQLSGENQLSLAEQFYTAPKVIRLSGEKERVEWERINQPELQADGSFRFLNDITASKADFVVSEQNFNASMRQAMTESLLDLAGKMPAAAMVLTRIAIENSDFPNKQAIVSELRRMTGQPDPAEEMSDEDRAALEAQQQAQQRAMELQEAAAVAAIEEVAAKVRKLNAEASKIEQEAGGDPQTGADVRDVQSQAAEQMQQMQAELQKLQAELRGRQAEAAAKVKAAQIQAVSDERVARIQADAGSKVDALMRRLEAIESRKKERKL
jgi:hypothetical protein